MGMEPPILRNKDRGRNEKGKTIKRRAREGIHMEEKQMVGEIREGRKRRRKTKAKKMTMVI